MTNAERKARMLQKIVELLDDPTCKIDYARGVRHFAIPGDPYRHSEPTKGQTVTITVHGGAREVDETLIRRITDGPLAGDLSPVVRELHIHPEPEARHDRWLALKNLGPITITGHFLGPDQALCARCGHVFAVGPVVPIASRQDTELGPVCDACTMEVLDGGEEW